MFACPFVDAMILRHSEPDRAAPPAEGWKAFEPVPGWPVREYLAVPARILGSPGLLAPWVKQARAYAESLPPEATKKR